MQSVLGPERIIALQRQRRPEPIFNLQCSFGSEPILKQQKEPPGSPGGSEVDR